MDLPEDLRDTIEDMQAAFKQKGQYHADHQNGQVLFRENKGMKA